jgi:lipopolysaccharide/colanic/teichoic acid biosynthesis glycosyltransferase
VRQSFQRAAELYLLIEPEQLVVFDLGDLTERLTWLNAKVTRVRLTNSADQLYSEHVLRDSDGYVTRIERRYRCRSLDSARVILTSSAKVAAIWMAAASSREGWARVRRSVPWARVDHGRCRGKAYSIGNSVQESRFIDRIVELWPHPDQAIDGIAQLEPGVWHPAGEKTVPEAVRIGPLWLGRGAAAEGAMCIVGPAWVGDSVAGRTSGNGAVTVRDIVDVELAEGPRPGDRPPDRSVYQFFKRLFDIALSFAVLLLLSPLLVGIALAIWLQDGRPIFFGHVRQTRGGRDFRCWKFRTMQRDAEKIARTLDAYNVCDGPQVFIQNDPRVTPIGHKLRSLHLDELPQFFNVLVGDMSIVGPRPSPDKENQFCPAWRDVRLSVRPGITGLWQLMRTRTKGEDFQEWIKYDIQYVRRANFWFDLSIIIRTAQIVVLGRRERAAE